MPMLNTNVGRSPRAGRETPRSRDQDAAGTGPPQRGVQGGPRWARAALDRYLLVVRMRLFCSAPGPGTDVPLPTQKMSSPYPNGDDQKPLKWSGNPGRRALSRASRS